MDRAAIKGKHSSGKELRHGFGVAMTIAKQRTPIDVLSQPMGYSETKTTAIDCRFSRKRNDNGC
jgi:hypothetical protein